MFILILKPGLKTIDLSKKDSLKLTDKTKSVNLKFTKIYLVLIKTHETRRKIYKRASKMPCFNHYNV